MFKAKYNLGPEVTNKTFQFEESTHNLRNDKVKSVLIRTVQYGTETLSYIGPKIWNMLPRECNEATSLQEFKTAIKKWTPDNCPCRICKVYLQGVGFI